MKDYYKILEVSPTATYADIKKSYRRLALQYHPDKNFGNTLYEAKFKDITEAYKVLSDVRQRQDYNNKRNYNARVHAERRRTQPITTPLTILTQTVDFRKKIAVLDPERMNKTALYRHIQQLLSHSNLSVLRSHNDPRLNRRIIDEILFCARFLPFAYVEKICFELTALAGTDNHVYRHIFQFSRDAKRREIWDKYKLIVGLLVAFLFCVLIYFISESY